METVRLNEVVRDIEIDGLRCIAKQLGTLLIPYIYNMSATWLCGYVEVPKGHIFYGKDYSEIEDYFVEVELTYSGELENCDGWFVGFDLAHYDDDLRNPDTRKAHLHTLHLVDVINKNKKLLK